MLFWSLCKYQALPRFEILLGRSAISHADDGAERYGCNSMCVHRNLFIVFRSIQSLVKTAILYVGEASGSWAAVGDIAIASLPLMFMNKVRVKEKNAYEPGQGSICAARVEELVFTIYSVCGQVQLQFANLFQCVSSRRLRVCKGHPAGTQWPFFCWWWWCHRQQGSDFDVLWWSS